MKKIITILLIILFLLVSPFAYALVGDTGPPTENTFILPASLQSVDEEAFVGTAAKTVIFPEGFTSLDYRVFEHADNLTDVYFPASTEYIGLDSLPHNIDLTVHGTDNSFAQHWASENGIAFVIDDIWTKAQASDTFHVESLLAMFFIICPMDEKRLEQFLRDVGEFIRSMRPQDRPELNAIDYRFP